MGVAEIPAVRTELGEGPLWDSERQCLWFVDIMRGHVHRWDPAAGRDRVYDVSQPVGAVACTAAGDVLCAVRDGFARLDPDSGRVTPFVEVEKDLPRNRMNDGSVDARGRFWAGTMSMDGARNAGALYCLAPDGSVTKHLSDVTTSNGIDWTTDNRRMYYVDTGEGRIDLFDFDLDRGAISNRRPFVAIDPKDGKPDGLVLDAEDHVWLALWRGSQVRRYAPDGRLVETVALPTPLTTKPAFGGAALADLYVTSAFIQLTAGERAQSPAAGAVFRMASTARGRAPNLFG
ncbi:MAG: SMP-30/gluconolactonase/LRE family protein [Acidobacteria bacterium]|nr:MAG: SMP-30/gluconolactonase/LRE family protein [Acidobacteriota bacterium]